MIFSNRLLFPQIINFIEDAESIVIHGSRQVGKTTIMKMIGEYLEKNNLKHII
jgi:predicted AAA+ superfamily ATPase